MKTLSTLLALVMSALLMIASGCSDSGLVGLDETDGADALGSVTAAESLAKNHAVSSKGKAWGMGTIVGAPGDCTVGGVPGLPVEMSGEGIGTHFGRYTFVQTGHCIELSTLTYEGTVVLYVANGDEVWAEYSGQSNLDGTFLTNGIFLGGTGRFEDASGSYVQVGVGTDPATGSFTFEFTTDGWILY